MSTPVAYTVITTLPSLSVRAEYLRWLAGEHVREVVAAGALSAQVVSLDMEAGGAICVEARYVFRDRASLEWYLSEHAPRLRAAGLALFGGIDGVAFRRTVGEIVPHA